MKQNKIPRNEYIRKPVGKTDPYKDDVIYSNLGQWRYPGQVTRIPSGDITMQGVPYPVYGQDNMGYSQMMYPGMDYRFPGQYVTEYPIAQKGLQIGKKKGNKENPVELPEVTIVGERPLEDKDSWLENIAEIVDPTGISSWDDVYRAYKNTGMSGETLLEALGAIPLLGRIGKSGKVIAGGFGLLQDAVKASKYLPANKQKQFIDKAFDVYQKYNKADGKELDEALGSTTKILKDKIPYINPTKWSSSDKAINVANKAFKVGRVSDAVQAALGSKDDSGFTWDMRHGEVPMYNGRNIFPQIELGEHGDFAYGGIPKAQTGKQKGNPISDWWYNTEDVQSTYKMAPDVDPFVVNWLQHPETQRRLKENLSSSIITNDVNPGVITKDAVGRLRKLPMFSRELVKKADINYNDIDYNNELQGWKSPSTFLGNPYYSGDPGELGVYMPNYHVSMVNSFNQPGVVAHEQTHATGPFQKVMEDVIWNKYYNRKNPQQRFTEQWGAGLTNYDLEKGVKKPTYEEVKAAYPNIESEWREREKYLDNDGMYPRIMDIRRTLKLKPGQKVNKSILENKAISSPLDDLRHYYDDDTIIDILNTIAKSKSNNSSNTAMYGGDPSLPNITGHYKQGGWLDEYPDGGSRNPIYVTDKNDPKLRAYNDSLDLYNFSKYQLENELNQKGVLDHIVDIGFGFLPRHVGDRDYSKRVFGYAKNLIKNNPRIKIGLPGAGPMHTEEEYKKEGSTDIYHPTIKPIGLWVGDAVNAAYKKPVQPIIYKEKPKEEIKPSMTKDKKGNPIGVVGQKSKVIKPKENTVKKSQENIKVYTNKKEFDKANRAYQDSLIVYNTFAGDIDKLIKTKNYDDWNKRVETFDYTKVDPSYQRLKKLNKKAPTPIKKKDKSFDNFNSGYAEEYKKPVVKPVYQEENIRPDRIEPKKVKLDNINSEELELKPAKGIPKYSGPPIERRWDFNNKLSTPVMIYHIKGQEVGREYYDKDGKVYQTDYGHPSGSTRTEMNSPFDPMKLQTKKYGGWLDQYQTRGAVLPSETTQSMVPASVRRQMQMLEKKMPTKQQTENLKKINEKTEIARQAKEAEKKAIIEDRKARIADSMEAQKEGVIGNPNWRENLARQTQATGDKFRLFPNDADSFIDDWLNPFVMIGDMASGLGQAPYQAKESNSILPYAFAIGAPLLTGGLESIGTKGSNAKFVNNLLNPLNTIPGYNSLERKAIDKGKNILDKAKTTLSDVESNIKLKPKFAPTSAKVPQSASELANTGFKKDPYFHQKAFMEKKAEIAKHLKTPEGRKRLQSYIDNNPHIKDLNKSVDDIITDFENTTFETRSPYYRPDFYYPHFEKQVDDYINQGILPKEAAYDNLDNIDLNFSIEGKPLLYNVDPSNAYNWYRESALYPSYVSMGQGFTPYDAAHILEHEFAHLFQRSNEVKGIDDVLEGITLKTGKDFNKKSFLEKLNEFNPFNKVKDKGYSESGRIYGTGQNIPEKYRNEALNDQMNYWRTGNKRGMEKAAFAAEVRENLLQRGLLKNRYDEITPEMLEKHFKLYHNTVGDKYNLRLYDIMQNNKGNFKTLSQVLNKMPAAIPAVGAGYLGYDALQNDESPMPQQQQYGGMLNQDIEAFKRGGLFTPPNLKRKARQKGTSKNIATSINKVFTRNYDVFGPSGRNIYNPLSRYKTGGWLDNLD